MSSTEGRKRLEPRMGRGSWRVGAWAAAAMVVCSAPIALNKLGSKDGWDPVLFWLYTVWFVISVIQLLHLLRVRRNDWPFWDKDEARRADWDRRGRRL
jgi:hypothetical protein